MIHTSRTAKVIRGAGALVLAMGLLAACSSTEPGTGGAKGDTLQKAKDDKKINVGFANERPYAYRDGGKLLGEAPAIHGYVFKQIGGIELKPNLFEFGSLIQALNANRVDVVSAGMFITPERCKEAAFSNPEYVATTALLTKKGNPKGLSDYKSVIKNGDKLAVMTGAVELDQAKGSGVPKKQTQIVPDQQSGLDAVKSGRADAFALTAISLRALAKKDSSVQVADAFVPVIDGKEQVGAGAAVFRKGDTKLRDAFNAELKKLLADDGKWLSLVKQYGFTEAEKPDPSLTAEKLCQG
jgi:polar amino acid transport system substrate-binding protein